MVEVAFVTFTFVAAFCMLSLVGLLYYVVLSK